MSRRLPPLNALKAFEAAARHLSFTKAAEELFVTQAAVSHQIKALEDNLSIKLFRRKNRTLLLTEEGQSYFLDIKDIFVSLSDATEKLLSKTASGALTVASAPSFAIQWLVPRLSKFSELHPEIDVRIKAIDLDEGLLTDDVDVAIYYGRGNWPSVRADKLRNEYMIPVCSPALLTGPKPINSIHDLANHTLLHDLSRKDWKNWSRQVGATSLNVNQGPIFSLSSLVLQAAIYGQGVALGYSVLARPEIEAGRLVCPFEEFLLSKNAYYIVSETNQSELGKIKAFREWMLDLFEQEEACNKMPVGAHLD
ncbi:transcriptional regulator GcvA [Psychrobium sp. 1_MG-2023]|uniref:transcriptional regulator GcvA n=1 Tax=Psychrobium sp. 1_MG-2023 TaxID=3062624 RepID=UPI000C321F85|nr:transcriptional regulator GcvA [Psychrobium sp. 1_MG-2023]MDP2560934.1 transcriptional regulator GcvA [Psychrobium sp. 1_MG-2023]PKF56006.1 transcriptional regulator [Alteromonadales bacterium alter-6D02]